MLLASEVLLVKIVESHHLSTGRDGERRLLDEMEREGRRLALDILFPDEYLGRDTMLGNFQGPSRASREMVSDLFLIPTSVRLGRYDSPGAGISHSE